MQPPPTKVMTAPIIKRQGKLFSQQPHLFHYKPKVRISQVYLEELIMKKYIVEIHEWSENTPDNGICQGDIFPDPIEADNEAETVKIGVDCYIGIADWSTTDHDSNSITVKADCIEYVNGDGNRCAIQFRATKAEENDVFTERFLENILGYGITDGEITLKSGKKFIHHGEYREATSKEAKTGKYHGITDPVVVPVNGANAIVPRSVGQKVAELSEKASSNCSQNLKKNVSGLDELNKVESDYSREKSMMDKLIYSGNGRVYTPKVTSTDVQAVRKKYPTAVKYKTAQDYANSSNYEKLRLGKAAMDKIRLGGNPDKVLAEMKSEWSKQNEKAMWD